MGLFSSPITTMATLIYEFAFTVPVSMERDTLLPEYASYEQVFWVASISLYLNKPFYDLEQCLKITAFETYSIIATPNVQ